MEKKLEKLFEYQRFERNQALEKMIRQTEERFARELTDDDLAFVNAAGDPVKDAEKNIWEKDQEGDILF